MSIVGKQLQQLIKFVQLEQLDTQHEGTVWREYGTGDVAKIALNRWQLLGHLFRNMTDHCIPEML